MSRKNDNKIDITVNDDVNSVIMASKITTLRSFDSYNKIASKPNELPAISGWAITDKQIITEIVIEDTKKTALIEKGNNSKIINNNNNINNSINKDDNKKVDTNNEKSTQTITETINETTNNDNNKILEDNNDKNDNINVNKTNPTSEKMKQLFLASKSKKRKYILLTAALVTIPIFICLVTLLILFAFVPCVFRKCHKNASVCVNHIFYAECICDYGYAGDGIKYCDECGITYAQQNARIIGGSTAVPHSWPASVLIITSYKTDVLIGNKLVLVEISFMCGGTLLNRKSVLTAAHCIIKTFDYEYLGNRYEIKIQKNKYYPTEESMYRVFAGLQDKSILLKSDISPTVSLEIDKITMHEEYDEDNVLNDIAILRLKDTIELNKYVQLACLPNPKWGPFYPTNMPAWALGWGTTSENGQTPETLKNVRINIYSNNLCDFVLPVRKNHLSQICAGDINGGRDTCQGDSGGSLFVRDNVNNKLRYVSAGLVSYGDGCGKKNKPGVYTRNIYFLDWIKKNSKFVA